MENPTIREVFEEWNDRRLELKKISNATHLRNTQIFNRHYKEFGDRRIKSIVADDVEEFLEQQIPLYDLTAKAFSDLKTVTRGLLKRAKKRKLITFNVEELFQELDVSKTDFKKVVKEDYEEVFDETEIKSLETLILREKSEFGKGIISLLRPDRPYGEPDPESRFFPEGLPWGCYRHRKNLRGSCNRYFWLCF